MSKKKKILVVDDDPDFVSLAQTQLEKLDCEVDVAYDGVEGMAKVKNNPPDIVVLDVMMPNKDGFKMCKELKQDSELSDIPVIMLTAVADRMSETHYSQYDAMSMEAEDYIPKGADCIKMMTKSIREFLEL